MKKLIVFFFGLILSFPAHGDESSIKIGEMMSYTGAPEFSYPFRNGWQMALDDFNAQGGVNGRKVEVISRDDQADTAKAVLIAQDLVMRDHVVMLMGAGLDHVGLAVSDFAKQNKIPFIKQWGGACDLIGHDKNPYWFITMECIDVYARIFAQEAAKKPFKRWAIIAPNYQYGRTISAAFKKELMKLKPDVEFVDERYPNLGKINAQEEVLALKRAKPEAVFNQLFTSDLPQYIRAAKKLGFFDNIFVIGDLVGTPLAIRELGADYPDGWFSVGVASQPDFDAAKTFHDRYVARYSTEPDGVSYDGYKIMQFSIEALRKAKNLDGDSIAEALRGLQVESPIGLLTMRPEEQQIYNNYWLGYTHNNDGKGSFEVTQFSKIPDSVMIPESSSTMMEK